MRLVDPWTEVGQAFGFGVTYGAFVWLPLTVFVLVAFGLPVAHVQAVTVQGLSRGERAERLLSASCAAVCVFGLVLAWLQKADGTFPWGVNLALVDLGIVALKVFAGMGLVATASALALVHARERTRRAFLERATVGEVEGVRVAGPPHARRLVRVAAEAGTYRASANDPEELFLIDEEGHATHAVARERRLP